MCPEVNKDILHLFQLFEDVCENGKGMVGGDGVVGRLSGMSF